MIESLTHEAFACCLNTTFHISVDEGVTLDAELTEVSEHLLSPQQERFSLVFRAPNDIILSQGTRRIEHERMGQFELFLVPLSRDERGTRYEAVFNRLRKAEPPAAAQ